MISFIRGTNNTGSKFFDHMTSFARLKLKAESFKTITKQILSVPFYQTGQIGSTYDMERQPLLSLQFSKQHKAIPSISLWLLNAHWMTVLCQSTSATSNLQIKDSRGNDYRCYPFHKWVPPKCSWQQIFCLLLIERRVAQISVYYRAEPSICMKCYCNFSNRTATQNKNHMN